MTGGLLQLVAVGIDSIFLTSNPSITLFKIVYKRHTNFSLVTRKKQLSLIKQFGTEGSYTLQKEADCIHKMWLNLNISDFKLEYPKSTYKYIKSLCAKYNINYSASKADDDIVTYNEYITNIIPLFLDNIDNNVTHNNDYIIYIKNDNDFVPELNSLLQRSSSVVKHCLNGLYNSYKIDASGTHVTDGSGNPIINSVYMIFFKLELIRGMFRTVNEMDPNYYKYLDEKYYNYSEYVTDKIEFIYNFAINRHSNIFDTVKTINLWVDTYLDRLFSDMIQVLNIKNEYLINSTDNKLDSLKYNILKFINSLQFLLTSLIDTLN